MSSRLQIPTAVALSDLQAGPAQSATPTLLALALLALLAGAWLAAKRRRVAS